MKLSGIIISIIALIDAFALNVFFAIMSLIKSNNGAL